MRQLGNHESPVRFPDETVRMSEPCDWRAWKETEHAYVFLEEMPGVRGGPCHEHDSILVYPELLAQHWNPWFVDETARACVLLLYLVSNWCDDVAVPSELNCRLSRGTTWKDSPTYNTKVAWVLDKCIECLQAGWRRAFK